MVRFADCKDPASSVCQAYAFLCDLFGANSQRSNVEPSYKGLDDAPDDSLSNSWVLPTDADNFGKYFFNCCAAHTRNLDAGVLAARADVQIGQNILRRIFADSCALPLRHDDIGIDPPGVVRSILWALMERAIKKDQGFTEGTFVIYGKYAEHLFYFLLPYLHSRWSSHFSKRAVPLNAADASKFLIESSHHVIRKLEGGAHFGIDVDNLPAGHKHVVIGLIRLGVGGASGCESATKIGVYLKPEREGINLTHAVHWLYSQAIRTAGSEEKQIQHDEGAGKRKEYVLQVDKTKYQQLSADVASAVAECQKQDVCDMHRQLEEQRRQLGTCIEHCDQLLTDLRQRYGEDEIHLRCGHEVLIQTSEFLIWASSPVKGD